MDETILRSLVSAREGEGERGEGCGDDEAVTFSATAAPLVAADPTPLVPTACEDDGADDSEVSRSADSSVPTNASPSSSDVESAASRVTSMGTAAVAGEHGAKPGGAESIRISSDTDFP